MRQPIILDGKNLYDPERMRRRGFGHHCGGGPAAISARACLIVESPRSRVKSPAAGRFALGVWMVALDFRLWTLDFGLSTFDL